MLKRVVSDSAAYKEVESAFGKLNDEAHSADGFLAKIANQHTSLTNDAGYAIITGAIPRTIDVEK